MLVLLNSSLFQFIRQTVMSVMAANLLQRTQLLHMFKFQLLTWIEDSLTRFFGGNSSTKTLLLKKFFYLMICQRAFNLDRIISLNGLEARRMADIGSLSSSTAWLNNWSWKPYDYDNNKRLRRNFFIGSIAEWVIVSNGDWNNARTSPYLNELENAKLVIDPLSSLRFLFLLLLSSHRNYRQLFFIISGFNFNSNSFSHSVRNFVLHLNFTIE